MTDGGRYAIIGVFVSRSVADALEAMLYETAGVVDLEGYFDPDTSSVPAGDPGAEATDELLTSVVSEFAELYDAANFEAAKRVDPDGFVLRRLAATPDTVTVARERFKAAATIQDTDLRTVHTAILSAHLSDR